MIRIWYIQFICSFTFVITLIHMCSITEDFEVHPVLISGPFKYTLDYIVVCSLIFYDPIEFFGTHCFYTYGIF